MNLRIHSILHGSRANGPGLRSVIWLQGCTLNCPRCFNPQTHVPDGGWLTSPEALMTALIGNMTPDTEGITISGGEPLEQAASLTGLLKEYRQRTDRSVIVLSGHTQKAIMRKPEWQACLAWIDVLICGPYQEKNPGDSRHYLASGNQTLWFLSERYGPKDFSDLPVHEIIINPDGKIITSGLGAILKN